MSIVSDWGRDHEFLNHLFITKWHAAGGHMRNLPEIRQGEVWRLITPIFIHFWSPGLGPAHLIFNMLWLFDLGCMIEGRQGTWRLVILVLVLATASNLGQFFWQGRPTFGGMSGVVYGLFGYCWMRGKYDPVSGLRVHPQTITMAVAWFFLCVVGLVPNVANTAHGVGLGFGMAWGALSSLSWFRRRPK